MRCLICLRSFFILLNRLAFLAADDFARVSDALALVRLRRVIAANVSRDLTDKMLVDAGDADLRVLGDGDFDAVWNREKNRVRKPEADVQDRTLHRCFETNAFNDE